MNIVLKRTVIGIFICEIHAAFFLKLLTLLVSPPPPSFDALETLRSDCDMVLFVAKYFTKLDDVHKLASVLLGKLLYLSKEAKQHAVREGLGCHSPLVNTYQYRQREIPVFCVFLVMCIGSHRIFV